MEKVGFIGGGQMAEAIIKGGLAAAVFKGEEVVVSEPSESRRAFLAEKYGVEVLFDNLKLIERCAVVILAVKPQIVPQVLSEIRTKVEERQPLLISIAAGVTLSQMTQFLGEGARLVRVMPNTPALVLAGVSALCKGPGASEDDLKTAEKIFSALGEVVRLPETLFDAVTGLSGSGPAYVFAFIEALVDGGVKEGLPREVAEKLAVETVFGAAKLMKETRKDPYALKAMVTSPGGTTIAGLKALADRSFHGTVMEAVSAATRRSRELGKD